MGDDLTTPSSLRQRIAALWRRLPILPALLVLLGAALVSSLAYVLVVDDPLGGEPVAVVPIQSPATQSPAAAEDSEEQLAIRPSLEDAAGDEPQDAGLALPPADIVIRDPHDASPEPSAEAQDDLVEPSRHGLLPAIAPDGRRPADAYAAEAPSLSPDTPRIAILVGSMGLSGTVTEDAIRRLPAAVTLAFAPYGREVERLTRRARQAGHEIMVQVPLEPYDFPDNDPGPHTLLTGLSDEQNRDRLHWVLSRFTGYVGATNYMGGRFSSSERVLRPFLGELRERGLFYAEDGSSPQSIAGQTARNMALPYIGADVVIDANPTRAAIAEALAELEELAVRHGRALGVASGLPAGIEEIADWIQGLEARGIAVVPVTALVRAGES